jgi:hypothetical protein
MTVRGADVAGAMAAAAAGGCKYRFVSLSSDFLRGKVALVWKMADK